MDCAQLIKQRYINVTRRKIRNVCLTLSRPRATATTKRGAKETEENPPDSTVNRHQFDYGDDYNQAHQSLAEPHESTATHGGTEPPKTSAGGSDQGEGRGSSSIPCPRCRATRWRSPWLEPGGAARRGGSVGRDGGRGAARRGEVWN